MIQNLTDIFLFAVVFNSSQIAGVVIAALGPLLQIAVILLERKRDDDDFHRMEIPKFKLDK